MTAALACAGARVFLTGWRQSKLYEAVDELRSLGISAEKFHVVPADVTSEEQIERAFGQIQTSCQALDGLINNAAVAQSTRFAFPLLQESLECWDEIMRVNLRAPWLVARTALPHMLISGVVKVLFITSEAGWGFAPGFGQYNVSKAALNSLTVNMAEECHARYPDMDIQINGLDPGQARTEMNRGSTRSPFIVACMALLLLSHPKGGPNGKFFSQDGRHLEYTMASAYEKPLNT